MQHSVSSFVSSLKELKPRDLGISSYSRKSLRRTLSAAEFYTEIYLFCLDKALALCSMSPQDMTIVDYGGGHGLLSILAKQIGFGRVIYVDNNPDALQTVSALSERIGFRPDTILEGDATTLKTWCSENGVRPDMVLGMDVIEHIYVLDEFFAQLHEISPSMGMIFTTASNPYNKRVVRRLHRAMQSDELGTTMKKGFWKMRRDHIRKLHHDMSDNELDYWADNTRGLVLADVERAVEARSPNLLFDKFNTCDPVSGSWTERLLPAEDYRQLLNPYGYTMAILPGRYNEHRRGPKAWISRCYNRRIDKVDLNKVLEVSRNGKDQTVRKGGLRMRQRRRYCKSLKVAPFIYLIVRHER
ncbi:MAG: SAM-dependent methyltransferase [Bacteroidales bacterium]|nr:SAM-dependent methyltransferase [Bacteroidales bacterium]